MIEKKYTYTLSELIDRLCIVQLKETFNPELKSTYAEEIRALVQDINLSIPSSSYRTIDAEFLRDVIVLAQVNLHIWNNEDAERKADITEENINWEKRYKQLRLTHSLNNGVRNVAKKRIQSLVGGRIEYKNMTLGADDCKDWVPSGY